MSKIPIMAGLFVIAAATAFGRPGFRRISPDGLDPGFGPVRFEVNVADRDDHYFFTIVVTPREIGDSLPMALQATLTVYHGGKFALRASLQPNEEVPEPNPGPRLPSSSKSYSFGIRDDMTDSVLSIRYFHVPFGGHTDEGQIYSIALGDFLEKRKEIESEPESGHVRK